MKEFPLLSMFNIHENLLESLLELQNYADVQAVLAKYDGEATHRDTRTVPTRFSASVSGLYILASRSEEGHYSIPVGPQ